MSLISKINGKLTASPEVFEVSSGACKDQLSSSCSEVCRVFDDGLGFDRFPFGLIFILILRPAEEVVVYVILYFIWKVGRQEWARL